MGVFREMDPELAWRLIEGYKDELTPAARVQDAFYRQFRCPRCKGTLNKEVNARTAFSEDSLVPKALLRCPTCSYLVDPHTNLVVESGNPAKVPTEIFSPFDPEKK